MEKIDYNLLGNKLCQDCRLKIAEMTKNVSKIDLVRPKRIARKFHEALCAKCEASVLMEIRKR